MDNFELRRTQKRQTINLRFEGRYNYDGAVREKAQNTFNPTITYDKNLSAKDLAADQLGNGILGTNRGKNKVFDRFFAPFGEVYNNHTYNGSSSIVDFAGITQDLDPSLYDAAAREQSPFQGRWLNPDPSGMSAVTMSDPQTLNRYSYVRNSAMSLNDPSGLRPPGVDAFYAGVPNYGGAGGIGTDYFSDVGDKDDEDAKDDEGSSTASADSQQEVSAPNSSSPQVVDTVNSALQQPNLSNCLNIWIGPGLVLTNDNLPYMNATKSETQLATIAGSKDPMIEGTVKEPVPASGRSTVYVAKEIMGDKNEAMRVYTHETGNVLAMQKFASGGNSGAYLGARGGSPGIAQRTGNNPLRDRDIGYQIEVCVFGPPRIRVPSETITVIGN